MDDRPSERPQPILSASKTVPRSTPPPKLILALLVSGGVVASLIFHFSRAPSESTGGNPHGGVPATPEARSILELKIGASFDEIPTWGMGGGGYPQGAYGPGMLGGPAPSGTATFSLRNPSARAVTDVKVSWVLKNNSNVIMQRGQATLVAPGARLEPGATKQAVVRFRYPANSLDPAVFGPTASVGIIKGEILTARYIDDAIVAFTPSPRLSLPSDSTNRYRERYQNETARLTEEIRALTQASQEAGEAEPTSEAHRGWTKEANEAVAARHAEGAALEEQHYFARTATLEPKFRQAPPHRKWEVEQRLRGAQSLKSRSEMYRDFIGNSSQSMEAKLLETSIPPRQRARILKQYLEKSSRTDELIWLLLDHDVAVANVLIGMFEMLVAYFDDWKLGAGRVIRTRDPAILESYRYFADELARMDQLREWMQRELVERRRQIDQGE